MIIMLLWCGVFVLGFLWMGYAITHVHAATHSGWLQRKNAPVTLGLYGWLHLDHHREIPERVAEARRTPILAYVRSAQCMKDVIWVARNLWHHERWVPLRILLCSRAVLTALMTFGVVACFGASVGKAAVFGLVAGLASVMASATLLFCYDLWHLWTHAGGPFFSSSHAMHHGMTRKFLGMWRWNNIDNARSDPLLAMTMWDVRLAERVLRMCARCRYDRWQSRAIMLRLEHERKCRLR